MAEKRVYHSTDPTELYLREIGYYPLLTPEEELALSRRVVQKDEEARKKMIASNLRLVIKIARRYIKRGLDFSDLIEEGNLGLMHAVEKFDPEMGFRFSTYATWWIRQSIERAVMNKGRMIRLPIYVYKELGTYWQAARQLAEKLPHEPTAEEIAEKVDKPVADVRKMLDVSRDVSSLDAVQYADSERTVVEGLIDANNDNPLISLEDKDIERYVDECLDELNLKHQAVLMRRFGVRGHKRQTLEEIGQDLGITRERVRQIQIVALRKLRKILQKRGLGKEVLEK